jgi:hypothetical protein
VIRKHSEKILKYKDLTTEIQRMWNVKTNVMPPIIETTETILKWFNKYLKNTPGKHDMKELRTTATWSTAHILRTVLM